MTHLPIKIRWIYSVPLIFMLSITQLYAQESNCGDGIDNDGDGLIDCFDGDCYTSEECDLYEADYCQSILPDSKEFGMQLRNNFVSGTYTVRSTGESKTFNPTGYDTPKVADVDNDGVLEIVVVGDNSGDKGIYIFDPVADDLEYYIPIIMSGKNAGTSIANVDTDPFVEIFIATGKENSSGDNSLRRYDFDGSNWSEYSNGNWPILNAYSRRGFPADIVDFNEDGKAELLFYGQEAGGKTAKIYDVANGEVLVDIGAKSSELLNNLYWKDVFAYADVIPEGFNTGSKTLQYAKGVELITGNRIYTIDIESGNIEDVWDSNPVGVHKSYVGGIDDSDAGQKVALGDMNMDGFLDVISSGQGKLSVWDPLTNAAIYSTFDLGGGRKGSVACIGDVDGDLENRPEIGIVSSRYVEVLRANDATGKLERVWGLANSDGSGETACNFFDFEGDGSVEMVYRDEDDLWVYEGEGNGSGGAEVLLTSNETYNTNNGLITDVDGCSSNTGNEHPIIVDVDQNDRADIVVACEEGIRVYRDRLTPWIASRKIFNQRSYNYVNINDDLTIPAPMQQNHKVDRLNNYLTQLYRIDQSGNPFYPAPDFTVEVKSIENLCSGADNDEVDFVLNILNYGDGHADKFELPITFYDGDPSVAGARFIKQEIVEIDLYPLNAHETHVIGVKMSDLDGDSASDGLDGEIYITINDNVKGLSVGDYTTEATQLPNSPYPECNYDNNTVGPFLLSDCALKAPIITLDKDESSHGGSLHFTDFATSFTEDGVRVSITDSDVEITDDGAEIYEAIIELYNPLDGSNAEGLYWDATALSDLGISTLSNQGDDIVYFSGNASLSAYQDAIKLVSYQNTSDIPNQDERLVIIRVKDVNDGLESGSAVCRINIQGVNDLPSSEDKTVSTEEDINYIFNGTEFEFSDPDKGTLTAIRIETLPSKGTLYFDENLDATLAESEKVNASDEFSINDVYATKLIFVPVTNESGIADDDFIYTSFSFKVKDEADYSSDDYTVTVRVIPTNDPPTAADNTFTLVEDNDHTFAPSDFNFNDTDGDELHKLKFISIPAKGSFFNDKNSNGEIDEGECIAPYDELLEEDINQLIYRPAANDSGDPYAYFDFYVNDQKEYSEEYYQINFVVTPFNDAPVAEQDSYNLDEGSSLTILTDADKILYNDSDVEDEGLSISQITFKKPDNSVITILANVETALTYGDFTWYTDGSFTYEQNVDITLGEGGELKEVLNYKITDGNSESEVTQVEITINGKNDPPVAEDDNAGNDFYENEEHTANLLTNDSDPDGDDLSIANVGGITSGTYIGTYGNLVWSTDGSFTYSPDQDKLKPLKAGESKTETIPYTIEDGNGEEDDAILSIKINGINDLPTAENITIGIDEDASYQFDGNEFQNVYEDLDNDALSKIQLIYDATIKGSWWFNGAEFTSNQEVQASDVDLLEFLPTPNGHGSEHGKIGFRVHDGAAFSERIYLFRVNVSSLNDLPTATLDSYTVLEDASTTNFMILSNDDFGGDGVGSISITVLPNKGGSVVLNDNGTSSDASDDYIEYTPSTNYSGEEKFSYKILDSDGDASEVEVTITVSPQFDAPSSSDKTVTTNEDATYNFETTDIAFSDVDGDFYSAFQLSSLPLTEEGVLQYDKVAAVVGVDYPDRSKLSFVPSSDYSGDSEFTFKVKDDSGDGTTEYSIIYTVSIDVLAVNDLPVLTANNATVSEGFTGVITDIGVAGSDVDGDALSYALSGSDAADFTIDADGNISFVSVPDYESPVDSDGDNVYDLTVDLTAGDEKVSKSITVTVTGVNDNSPVLSANNATVSEGFTGVITDIDVEGSDADGDALSYALSGLDADDFEIDESSGEISFVNSPDYESPVDSDGDNVYELTIDLSAGGDLVSESITVTVTGINDNKPELSAENATVSEGFTGVITDIGVAGSDADGDALIYALSGFDAADFMINSDGNISFVSVPDYELPVDADTDNVYELTVELTTGGETVIKSITVRVTGVNDNSPVLTANNATVAEGFTGVITDVGVVGSDADGDALNYALSGADADDFTIDADGNISFVNVPDYELPVDSDGDNVYDLTVELTAGGETVSKLITVTLTGVNDNSPVLSANNATVSEGFTGVITDIDVEGNDADGDALSYALSGADADNFTIDADGKISFVSVPDYELPVDADTDNNYELTVELTAGGETVSKSITVTVTGVNDNSPVLSANNATVPEGFTGVITDIDVEGSDADGDALSYALSGADANDFTIDVDGNISFVNVPDYELPVDTNTDNVYELTIDLTAGGETVSESITVTVTGVNDNSPVLSANNGTVSEGFTGVITDIDVEGSDADGDALSYALSGADANDFTIDADGKISFVNVPDYELPVDADTDNNYELTVELTAGGETVSKSITVTVTGVNDNSPVLTANNATVSEGFTGVITDIDVEGSDADGDALSYALSGADADDFTIDADGNISFVSVPDYELPSDSNTDNVYELTVELTAGSEMVSKSITVTVTGLNDNSPVLTANNATVSEGHTGVITDAGVSGSDADGDALSYALSGLDADDFEIDESSGEISFVSVPDYESPVDSDGDNVYELTIDLSAGGDLVSESITVTVTGLNDNSPVLSANNVTVAEGHTGVITDIGVVGSDADGDALSYALSGLDADDFEIDESSGEIRFVDVPDYESPADTNTDNVYELTVELTAGSETVSKSITVTVTGVNDNCPVLTASNATVSEGFTGVITDIGVEGSDADSDALSYALSGADAADFTIDADGNISFIDVPDYELPIDTNTDNVYELTVELTAGSETVSESITVTVTGLNDNSPVLAANNATVAEGHTGVITDIVVAGSDADSDALSYALSGADATDFTIDADGNISFVDVPDYELPIDTNSDNVYELIVELTAGGETVSKSITVTVTGLNDNSPVLTANNATVAEGFTGVITDIDVEGSDADGDALSYALLGADADDFTIDAGGNISFVDVPDYESPADMNTDNVYELTIELTAGSETVSKLITVTVTGVNDNSPVLSANNATVAEGFTGVITDIDVVGSDADGDALSYALSGADANDFTIDVDGNISFVSVPDYELPVDTNTDNIYELTVELTAGDETVSKSITVTVTGVNDNSPVLSANNATVSEGFTGVITDIGVAGSDADGDALSYALSGADADDFTIDADGNISFISVPDYELPVDVDTDNIYGLTVELTAGSETVSESITVRVTGVNDNSPVLSANNAIVSEGFTGVITDVGVVGSDADGDALSYALSGLDAADFTIDSDGNISFEDVPDYESPVDADTDNIYELTVELTAADETVSKSITVTVTGLNDNSPVLTANNATVAEGFTGVITDIDVEGSDADGDALSYALSGLDAADFTIDSDGNISFEDVPDYESPVDADTDNIYELTVELTAGGEMVSESITVTVTGLNDNSPVLSANNAMVVEGFTGMITDIGVAGSDADGDALSYALSGTDADDFTIDADGNISFVYVPDYESPVDANTDNVYELTVELTAGGEMVSESITVTVTGLNDNSPVLSANNATVSEGFTGVITDIGVVGSDADGDALSYALSGADADDFTIDADGKISFVSVPDYESPVDTNSDNVYELTVELTAGGETVSQAVIVTVLQIEIPDSDEDGISDSEEGNGDTDGDGTPDYLDQDSDGDGIPDSEEGSGDTDDDGVPDYKDEDADGDGISDSEEGSGDTDGDSIPDYLDEDADGDGIPDSEEGNVDTDDDGTPDYKDEDSDDDGISDLEEGSGDTDGDGIPNYKDEDTDGDGISDSEEGSGDTDGDGIPNYKDEEADGDGIPDSEEGTVDTDDDGTPDYKDEDSDGDGISDSEEGNVDTDDDGTPDYLDQDSDDDGISDSEEGSGDTDGDGIPDYKDEDSDGDGIPDSEEGNVDTDDDGTPDYLDEDSDDDDISDSEEGSGDTDDDGIPDYKDDDADNDGIYDDEEGNVDTDNDGIPDYKDEDSDNDGILDKDEAGDDPFSDCDKDGIPDYLDQDLCDVEVSKGFSPDGDGQNDFWYIEGIELHPNNNVKIFNRWGNLIFERKGYNNEDVVWKGQAEKGLVAGGSQVPEGTYFYLIELGNGLKPLSGYVIIKR
ncbi:Ig-like domain-containing protein [Sediminitomix flava]|uniref:Gliding motility-associated-like protein n=1 Tax=Sediminitomix flava TaxID=379075 RepID=A0A315ZBN4_SEDFL|nr:Ig-like domain-containing protein [Sediminitomix flava]PWJ42198.1 gliding motility-associated-like protein [Sediminitomix flava]